MTNAEFLKGTIEHVPLPDASVDVVISNCVINLAADKDAGARRGVPGAAARRPVRGLRHRCCARPLPSVLAEAAALWTGCLAGALTIDDYLARLARAGFVEATVEITRGYDREALEQLAAELDPAQLPADVDVASLIDAANGTLASAFVRATHP